MRDRPGAQCPAVATPFYRHSGSSQSHYNRPVDVKGMDGEPANSKPSIPPPRDVARLRSRWQRPNHAWRCGETTDRPTSSVMVVTKADGYARINPAALTAADRMPPCRGRQNGHHGESDDEPKIGDVEPDRHDLP